jgi:holo-[acyl-carrier protein] synthase
MIVGIGIDLVEIDRISQNIEKHSERFLNRVFTQRELEFCMGRKLPAPGLAARFAAKEAAMKALGTGYGQSVGWHDVEVVGGGDTAPEIEFHAGAKQRAQMLGVSRVLVTITHERSMAAATVILES